MNDDAGFLHGEGGNGDDLDALVCVDGEGNVLHADDRVEEVLGYPRDEVADSDLSRFVPDGHTEMVKEYVRSEGGDTDRDSVQVPAVTADDGETSLSVRFERRDVEGEQRQVGVVYDTEIKRTDAEEFFDRGFIEDVLDTINDVFFVLNEDLDLLFWNQSVNDVTGYSDDEIEEMNPLDFIPPEERDYIFDEIMRVVEEGHALAEGHYLTKEGERVPYEFSGTLLVDDDGNRLVCGTGRDISERKDHQEKLRNLHDATRSLMESETREEVVEESIRTLLEVLDLTVSGIWLYDAEDDVLRPADWSRGAEEIFDEIPVYESGNSLSWRVFEDDETRVYNDVPSEDAYNPDTPVGSEMILPLGDYGVINVAEEDTDAFDDIDVSLAQSLATTVKAALENVDRRRELKERSTAMEESIDGMAILDENQEYVYVNQAHADMYGYDPEELVGETWECLYDENERSRMRDEVLPEFEEEGWWRGEATGLRSNGERFPQEITLTGTEFGGVVCVVRDITERKERENELEKYETIVEKSSDAVFIHDRRGGIEKVNRKACESLGYERDDLLGMTVFDIEEDLEREALLELWDEMETGDERTLEGAHTRADGSSFPVEVRLNKIEIDGDERFLALVRDVTERKERERQLRKQNERLEEFASLVSHDLRDPLNSARAQVALIRNEIDDSEPETLDSRRLDSLDEVHDRMEEIIEDVLTLTRKGKTVGEMDEVPLEETVDEAWSTSGTESAVLEKEDLGTVLADDERLRTVFENLFSNSVRHVGDDVTVRVGRLDGGNGFFVEDDGHGIPEGERDKVFDHGYTSSEEGTGLGLSIVRSVAEAHGWEVAVGESEDGGARFEFRFDVTRGSSPDD